MLNPPLSQSEMMEIREQADDLAEGLDLFLRDRAYHLEDILELLTVELAGFQRRAEAAEAEVQSLRPATKRGQYSFAEKRSESAAQDQVR